MTIADAIQELRTLNEPVPQPSRLPSEGDVSAMETGLGIRFHPDYRAYLLGASDVVLGALEPAEITNPDSHTFLPAVITDARKAGVPDGLLPFCEDNGDYFCLRAGSVAYWSHEGPTDETWPDLATWIMRVWIAEHA